MTGVQTCALPISHIQALFAAHQPALHRRIGHADEHAFVGHARDHRGEGLAHARVERRLMRGERGLDVGDRLRVTLLSTDPQRGFIDFGR